MKITVAGAGAGKTTMMASKIVDALTSIEAHQNIYCLAFTKAAVSRIKEKLSQHYAEIPSNIIVCTIHSFFYQEIISPYYFLLFGKQYERISPINLPDKPAYKNNKIKELDDSGLIHISVIPQRAKWVVVRKSGDTKKDRYVRSRVVNAIASYCGKIFVDEAQDIDDDTLAIIQTLDDAGIPIELVGDPKQDLRGHESFRKLLNRYGADISYISICHRCPQKHLRISNTLVPDEEKQTSEKEDGIVNFVFEGDIRTSEFIKAGNFDLVYISARNKRFETHPRKGSSNYFESLNHEISDVVKRRNPKASKYLIAKSSYYLTHCIITDIDGGDEPQNVMWKYFAGTLNGQQYTKIISAARKPAKETAAIPIVSTIDGIKGREGNNCLFILTADLAPYLFGENTPNNKTKNKLYVALTRSLYRLTILITAEVQKGYGSQYIQNYFTKLVSIG